MLYAKCPAELVGHAPRSRFRRYAPPRIARSGGGRPDSDFVKKKDESRWECQVESPSEVLLFLVLFVQPLFNAT